MKLSSSAPISDAEFNAVRALAAEGRPIPAIVMKAITQRVEAQAANAAEAEIQESQPQAV